MVHGAGLSRKSWNSPTRPFKRSSVAICVQWRISCSKTWITIFLGVGGEMQDLLAVLAEPVKPFLAFPIRILQEIVETLPREHGSGYGWTVTRTMALLQQH